MSDVPDQDLFISHASEDKPQYIYPLTKALSARQVTFWLDEAEIHWGDSVVGKINEGLRETRFALLCLSHNFLKRRWPEAEMSSVLSLQHSDGVKRVLPLILNSKDDVLRHYPLIAGIAFREFGTEPEKIASEISQIMRPKERAKDEIYVTFESVHTDKFCRLKVPRRASVAWLVKMAQAGMEVPDKFSVSLAFEFHIRWVLVDVAVESEWHRMPRERQRSLLALIGTDDGLKTVLNESDRLEDIGMRTDTVFHMYAIENEYYRPPVYYYDV